jgi:hypothetical protein
MAEGIKWDCGPDWSGKKAKLYLRITGTKRAGDVV